MSTEGMATAILPVNDVLVVGGGIGGLSAAIALGQRGVQTTVVERDGGTDGANIGFNYRALYALRELGILDQIIEHGQAHRVDEPSRFETVYKANGEQLAVGRAPELGAGYELPVTSVRLPRPKVSEIMRHQAREQGAELLIGHTYETLEPRADAVAVELTNGRRHSYDLVIGADGIYSGLRERFFPGADAITYLGRMNCRVLFENAPEHWRGGRHVDPDGIQRLITHLYPDGRFHLAAGRHMERRHVDQDEARAIVREQLEPFLGSAEMYDEIYERLDQVEQVIVTPLEWIYVPPPWHRGRIVLLGDALHATAPTLGSGGQMALEDSVVLAQELAKASNVEEALSAYASRREGRAKLVAETSAGLVRFDQVQGASAEEAALRRDAFEQLMAPY